MVETIRIQKEREGGTLFRLLIYFMLIFVILEKVCHGLENFQNDFLRGGGSLENMPQLMS